MRKVSVLAVLFASIVGCGQDTADAAGAGTENGEDSGYATTCVTYCWTGGCEMDCDKKPGSSEVGELCFGLASESQCKKGLVCFGGKCAKSCTADKYCGEGETCQPLDTVGYCTLPNVGKTCVSQNDCAGGTVCIQTTSQGGACYFSCAQGEVCKKGKCTAGYYGGFFCK